MRAPWTMHGGRFWWACGILWIVFSALLVLLSLSFLHGEGHASRPILSVVLLLLVWGALYGAAASRASTDPPPLGLVLAVALACRAMLLPSTPIQEDDVYRYIWDGRVAAAGIDPFRFSPAEIEAYGAGAAAWKPAEIHVLHHLAALRRLSPAMEEVFLRINNRAFPTVYPALVQAVFRAHAAFVPPAWPLWAHVTAMKGIYTVFDLAVLAALIALLRLTGRPPGVSVLYAWCPLVLKEVSNSGHMDVLPAAFLVAALLLVVKRRGFLSGAAIGAAVATKFFAALVLPIVLRALGWRKAALCVVGCALVLVPSFLAYPEGAARRWQTLERFVLEWEMNDAIFPWVERVWSAVSGNAHELALGTVAICLGAWVAILAVRTRPWTPLEVVLRHVFTVLAAAFLLGPLGFPWYFLWCVPLLPFARSRAWWVLPMLLSCYYLRFYLDYRVAGPLAGFPSGADFFDWVVAPVEFGLFYVALAVERAITASGLARRRRSGP